MQRWKNIFFNISLFLNCLLVFLLIFESKLSVPAWLQVAGRMHPLILHFPVALVILYALAVLIFPVKKTTADASNVNAADLLLLLAAFTSALTALMGLFLSKETGYDAEALLWHKWGGVAISIFTFGWYYFRNTLQTKKIISFSTAAVAVFLIIFVGHQGAGITHGQNFLLAPLLPEKKKKTVTAEEAFVYADMVQPILDGKCASCHNSNKAKGDLIMDSEALLFKGGKNGILWDTTATDLGLLLRRVHLPIEEKKHMPPQGKPQLTEEEIEIIAQWIRKGSSFKLKVADLPATDTLRLIANKIFAETASEEYAFEKADANVVKELNSVNRVVTELAMNSPALSVSFFNSQLFNADQLKELSKIKKQVVSLDLAKMAVKDADIKMISEFENLRTLNLNFSAITGAALPELKKLKFLKSLSLSGTKLTAADLKQLQSFPQLKTVYTWNTAVTSTELEQLRTAMKNIHFETGFKGDTIILKLSPPVVENETGIITDPIPLQLKHYINGTVIRYTRDGSDPDSLNSPIFKPEDLITTNVLIRAKAFKPGWISSDIIEQNFYTNKYTPDSIWFKFKPDPGFTGPAKQLTDLAKGDKNYRNGKWLGWRVDKMDATMEFAKAESIQSVTVSAAVDINAYIMPPLRIEVWGGNDLNNLKLLGSITPKQPDKSEAVYLRGYECTFAAQTVKYLRVVGTPVLKLPGWHPGKGDKGWLFVDEILFN